MVKNVTDFFIFTMADSQIPKKEIWTMWIDAKRLFLKERREGARENQVGNGNAFPKSIKTIMKM